MIFEASFNIEIKTTVWLIAAVISAIVGIFFLRHANLEKEEMDAQLVSKVRLGYAIFFWGWAATRVLFVLSDYEMQREGTETSAYLIYVFLGYITTIGALTILSSILEPRIRENKKKIVTIALSIAVLFSVIFAVVGIFQPEIIHLARIVIYILSGFAGAIIFGFYVYLILKTTGDVRKRAGLNLLGISLIFLGQAFDSSLLIILFYPVIWLPGTISAIGVIVFFLGHKLSE